MPNIAKVLKDEIARIARKESKAGTGPIRSSAAKLKRDVAGLKRHLGLVEKANRELRAQLEKLAAAQPAAPAPEPAGRAWISGKGIRSLRKRLNLSQAKFAKLAGVTTQAVYGWERKAGMLKLRNATKAALLAVRQMGAKEAKAKLAESAKPAPKKGRGK